MKQEAAFEVDVTAASATDFAGLSGDWNPLHTDAEHAATTPYRRPVLHGAFSAGLVSRMAGMEIPGRDCLLHGIRLKFVAPIVTPARLRVHGRLAAQRGDTGRVDVTVSDATSGRLYVEASYDFGRHEATARADDGAAAASAPAVAALTGDQPLVLVTGATGGLGSALMARLGDRAIGLSRSETAGMLHVPDVERVADVVGDRQVRAIVHCAWPMPDNRRFSALGDAAGAAIDHQVAQPLRQVAALANLLATRGTPGALLVLVGSTFAEPGRHNYRMPLYSLSKALVPELARILAVELGPRGRRCVAVAFDVIEGGMNHQLSAAMRLQHADRVPSGELPRPDDAAAQIAWVLENESMLVSGATLTLSGGAIP